MIEGWIVCVIDKDDKVREITSIEDHHLLVADGYLYFVPERYYLETGQEIKNVINPFAIFAPGSWGAAFKYYRDEGDQNEQKFSVESVIDAVDKFYDFSERAV